VSRADNQQERFVRFTGWIVGFVDGEGFFLSDLFGKVIEGKKHEQEGAIRRVTKYFMNLP